VAIPRSEIYVHKLYTNRPLRDDAKTSHPSPGGPTARAHHPKDLTLNALPYGGSPRPWPLAMWRTSSDPLRSTSTSKPLFLLLPITVKTLYIPLNTY
jgi:hypothetical protein